MTVDVKLLTQERSGRGRSSTQGSLGSVKLPFPDEAAYPAPFLSRERKMAINENKDIERWIESEESEPVLEPELPA